MQDALNQTADIRQTDRYAIPVAAMLERVAEELKILAGRIEAVEPHLSREHHGAATDDSGVRGLQGIDLSAQTASGLADFMNRLAEAMPAGLAVDVASALDAVLLAEMRDRLQGRPTSGAAESRPGGDIELF